MKRRKQRLRRKLTDARRSEELLRLRAHVTARAVSAMGYSRCNKATSYYSTFEFNANGVLFAGAHQVNSLSRKDCEKFIEYGFTPVDPKGHLEVLIEAIERTASPEPASPPGSGTSAAEAVAQPEQQASPSSD